MLGAQNKPDPKAVRDSSRPLDHRTTRHACESDRRAPISKYATHAGSPPGMRLKRSEHLSITSSFRCSGDRKGSLIVASDA